MKENPKLYIHASNVVGFGARTVAYSLLTAMVEDVKNKDLSIVLHLPDVPFWREHSPKEKNWEVVYETRPRQKIQRILGRSIDCLFTPAWLNNARFLVVLGDIPIRFKGKQIVLVHNPHLSTSRSSEKFKLDFFIFLRFIFRFNIHYVDCFIMQSDVIRSDFSLSYPFIANRIKSIPMPVPEWIKGIKKIPNTDNSIFRMVYPANDYLHKNHALIAKIHDTRTLSSDFIELKITLTQQEFLKLTLLEKLNSSWILFVGSLDNEQMKQCYLTSDALFFPSLKESYGFPLVEAMSLDLFIICADLPYARWMCGDQAIYFDPTCPHSALKAVDECLNRRNNGWKPNWESALSKIPIDWVQYSKEFLAQMK